MHILLLGNPRVSHQYLKLWLSAHIILRDVHKPFPKAQSSFSRCRTLEYIALMVFMLDFLHCLPKYLVCIFNSFRTYSCVIACRTFRVRFRIGADLKTTSICSQNDQSINNNLCCGNGKFTIILECFHLVSLLSILSRLMQENMFLEQCGAASPISRLSGVNSGWSPITQDGKSKIGIL